MIINLAQLVSPSVALPAELVENLYPLSLVEDQKMLGTKKFGFEDDYYSGELSWWQKTKPKIWSIFDEPYSSSAAKVRTFLTFIR